MMAEVAVEDKCLLDRLVESTEDNAAKESLCVARLLNEELKITDSSVSALYRVMAQVLAETLRLPGVDRMGQVVRCREFFLVMAEGILYSAMHGVE